MEVEKKQKKFDAADILQMQSGLQQNLGKQLVPASSTPISARTLQRPVRPTASARLSIVGVRNLASRCSCPKHWQ
eukprot:5897260-Amphidinium_carterae.1